MTEKFNYPTEVLKELAGIYALSVHRINLEIEAKNLDYDVTWDLINQETDYLIGRVNKRRDSEWQ